MSIFTFFSHHGVKRDWYRHNWAQWFGYLGHTPNIWRQKSVTLWQLSQCPIITFSSFSDVTKHLLLWQVSHSNPFTLLMHLWHQKITESNIWNCDIVTVVTTFLTFAGWGFICLYCPNLYMHSLGWRWRTFKLLDLAYFEDIIRFRRNCITLSPH